MTAQYTEWAYGSAGALCSDAYLVPVVTAMAGPLARGTRVLDVGCGNGALAARFAAAGCGVVGIDLSESGIAQARAAHPGVRFEVQAADAAVLDRLGEPAFDVVVSTEVVEHLYDPRAFAAGCFAATRPGGKVVVSTPYHGYLKNLTLAAAGKWESHANPLWDGGHIKLWSRRTLGLLLTEAGFTDLRFRGAGRAVWVWKSMVMAGTRPP